MQCLPWSQTCRCGQYPSSLFPQHAELLHGSGIPPTVARARGYVSVDTKARLKPLGFGEAQRRVPGLLIPIPRVRGTVVGFQYRPDNPRVKDGRPVKYESPRNSLNVLDVPAGCHPQIDDPAVPLFITEGARKADAAAARGLCCIGLSGVWAWRGTNPKGGKAALPDWESVALNGRKVYLAFDSDVTVESSVRDALVRLMAFLESCGADVEVIRLPPGAGGTKNGLDDYLVSGKGVGDLLSLAQTGLPADPGSAEPLRRSYDGPPIDLPNLLDEIVGFLRSYVVMSEFQASAVALWVAHTHVIRVFETTPYLSVRSAEKRSGKSTLLRLLLELVARPIATSNISDAALYRIIETYADAEPPTLVCDEVDQIFFVSRSEPSRPSSGACSMPGSSEDRRGWSFESKGTAATARSRPTLRFRRRQLAESGSFHTRSLTERSVWN